MRCFILAVSSTSYQHSLAFQCIFQSVIFPECIVSNLYRLLLPDRLNWASGESEEKTRADPWAPICCFIWQLVISHLYTNRFCGGYIFRTGSQTCVHTTPLNSAIYRERVCGTAYRNKKAVVITAAFPSPSDSPNHFWPLTFAKNLGLHPYAPL